MFSLIEKHEPVADCDCHDCALAERNRLRAELAALRQKIAQAVELRVGDPVWSDGTLAEMEGQRVALLPLDDGGEG